MQNQIELRRAVEQLEGRGRRRRFPKPLRSKLISYIRRRREAGCSMKDIGDEIGLSFKTVSRWLTVKSEPTSFRRVQVVREQPRGALTVHGPHGVRVEGMAVEDLAELLRRLG